MTRVRTIDAEGCRFRAASPADDDHVLGLMTEYMTWALATFEQTFGYPMGGDPGHTPESLRRFRPPSGLIALAEVGGLPVGVAALRTNDDGVVEIKRMFVRPTHRGTGIGAGLLDWLLDRCSDQFGARIVRLDSNRFMTAAHRLYESRGFTERDRYPGSEIPPELQDLWRFYELPLTPATGDDR
ncbi:GNAT family N-acetyltransferase [Microlunatus soli]|uniref:Acetyltransferase (GNAT) family protein n=1 Tax=Microlunatus soli TaxID=630515 RepID=A0A1H2AHP1_9ACTN|nr:GNAT family N-acetyltransferase [Microlunatus soli]SDT45369.1 Acetyltransferase (GNAT) family protein [Microlunatus soli]